MKWQLLLGNWFWGWKMKEKHFTFWRWAPVIASAVIMGMIGIISVKTVAELKKATYWREHTFKVILDAQALEDKLLDGQSGVDHYVTTGTPNLLFEYKTDTNIEARSDTGYWQSVEQYVRAKTDARFTHGLCPNCVKKWETDLTRDVSPPTGLNPSTPVEGQSI